MVKDIIYKGPAYIQENYKKWYINNELHQDEPSDSLALAGEMVLL